LTIILCKIQKAEKINLPPIPSERGASFLEKKKSSSIKELLAN